MSWIDTLARRFGYVKPSGIARRRFDGARVSRLTAGWATQGTALDAELAMDLAALRARARDLSINNDYARKFLQMVGSNVVGPQGFGLQALAADPAPAKTPDRLARMVIEEAFASWSRAGECDVTGRTGFADLCRLLARTVARDGEALVRCVRDRRFAFGYRLQLLDIDRLDIGYNTDLDNGNLVRMSVELDAYGAPVAYHLLTQHPGTNRRDPKANAVRERVPAADIFHLFVPERPEQTRGFPWMAAAMTRLNQLHGYEEAAIVAARTGAAKVGFFVSPDGTADALADGSDADGNFISEADPGSFTVLPQGYDFKSFNPDYPTQNYDSFVKSCLRGIASGLGVSYSTLANDLEGVNFSSIRSGTLEERESWMVVQGWFIETFLRPLFIDWLDSALLKGALTMPNGSALPATKRDKFAAHAWQGRRWAWVDPMKDIEASRLAVKSGIASPQMIAAQNGVDLDDVISGIAAFEQQVAEAKLTLIDYGITQAAPAPAPVEDAPAVKAARIAADAQTRSAELQAQAAREAKPPVFNINAAPINITTPEVRNEIAVPPAPTPEIHNEIIVQPAAVQIAAPEIRNVIDVSPTPIQLEARIDVPAPEVTVNLPNRKTETTIERDANGNITRARQLETDA